MARVRTAPLSGSAALSATAALHRAAALFRASALAGAVVVIVGVAPPPAGAAGPGVDPYDEVVDVTGLEGRAACAAMQAALNDALAGAVPRKRVLIRGRIGSAESPADFSMFHDAGRQGAGGRRWPYAVCHAYWTAANAVDGDGIVDGYPDPLRTRVIAEARATARSTASTAELDAPLCGSFSIDRKLATVVSGRGRGQTRWVAACEGKRTVRVEPDWETVPDASSRIRIEAHQRRPAGRVDLTVDYDLEVHYRNSSKQGKWRHAVFADVGMACYFVGDFRPRRNAGGCGPGFMDGIHRGGRITIHEYGRRDDGEPCAPFWLDAKHLSNRPYTVIWQGFGPGVQHGRDDVRLEVYGQGDRDNVGVVAFHTWSRDFRGWRIRGIGTGLWIAGSLNDTLYDPYIAGNRFGVVIGANAPWGAGWPYAERCATGFCGAYAKDSVSMNFRGGAVEGNVCGNFVMFGGYSGEVDRTFIETGARGADTYQGHSVIVGAGVCDDRGGRSPRQGVDRAGQVCADDLDCPGACRVDPGTGRTYGFQWDASMVSNRGSSDWFAFVLGKGTRREYLDKPRDRLQSIRVTGRGFGGEWQHDGAGEARRAGAPGLYFHASEGASVNLDVDAAVGTRRDDRLPAYDHYVSMPSRDLERVIERPTPGRHPLGVFPRRATCTEGRVALTGEGSPRVDWTIEIVGPKPGRRAALFEGVRTARRSGAANRFRSADLSRPYVDRGAEAWLVIREVAGAPDALLAHLRCWEDKW